MISSVETPSDYLKLMFSMYIYFAPRWISHMAEHAEGTWNLVLSGVVKTLSFLNVRRYCEALCVEWRNIFTSSGNERGCENIKYFISSIWNRTHNLYNYNICIAERNCFTLFNVYQDRQRELSIKTLRFLLSAKFLGILSCRKNGNTSVHQVGNEHIPLAFTVRQPTDTEYFFITKKNAYYACD